MQLMSNLTTNAVKFTPDGGTITIGLEHIEDEAVLWVKDTGVGIQPENLNRVFDRFYQTDPARTHTGGGFGLGLSIARWIVEAHGGTITVTSQPGQGATFTVQFPVYDPAPDRRDSSNGDHGAHVESGASQPSTRQQSGRLSMSLPRLMRASDDDSRQ
jgi:signal transduction histidine kinase